MGKVRLWRIAPTLGYVVLGGRRRSRAGGQTPMLDFDLARASRQIAATADQEIWSFAKAASAVEGWQGVAAPLICRET
jgi:hypothetical protein